MDIVKRIIKTTKFVVSTQVRFQKPINPVSARELKKEIQEMGPTYIKIGQFVSSRRDIFHPDVIDALKELQSNVDTEPQDVIPIIRERLADKLSKSSMRLVKLTRKPIAQASIGQVHVGLVELSSMKSQQFQRKMLAFKVRRPRVREDMEMDVAILRFILNSIFFKNMENIQETKELLEDFERWLLDESDYLNEVSNWKILEKSLRENECIILPRVYEDLSSSDVITMEYLPSRSIEEAKKTMDDDERKELAAKLMDSFVRQLVVHGVMHGDPHEGNLGISSESSTNNVDKIKINNVDKIENVKNIKINNVDKIEIVLYDMGNVIRVDLETRKLLKRLLFEIVNDNLDDALAIMKRISLFEIRDEIRTRQLLEKYVKYIKTVDVNVFASSSIEKDLEMKSNTKLPIKFSGTVFRIVRVFGILEGICKRLDPTFSYEPIFSKYTSLVGSDADYLTYKVLSDLRKIARMVLEFEN